jgi:sortase A
MGRTLVGLGVLTLLFVAYQLWGTDVSESQSQHILRHQLAGLLPGKPVAAAPPESPASPIAPPGVAGALAAPTRAPADGAAVGIIQIPRIGVDKAIVEGTTTTDLRQGPGHYSDTPLPGQPGNSAIAGHRTTYGAPFSRLSELGRGDQILVTTHQGTFWYDVSRSLVVEPTDVSVIAPSSANQLTLTTCTPRFSAAQRLVVQASLTGPPALATPVSQAPSQRGSTLGGETGGWLEVVAWGLVAVAVAIGVWLLARSRRRRWLVYVPGTPVLLAVLFMFLVATSKLLPASI